MHFWDHADSEYILGLRGIDRKDSKFIGNKYTHLHRPTQLYSID